MSVFVFTVSYHTQDLNMIRNLLLCLLITLIHANNLFGQVDTIKSESLNFHFQQTIIVQEHPSFNSPYIGKNSLNPNESSATSLTSTFFLGFRIFNGAEIYFNPELAGGMGLSSTTGAAGFPNGEIYRVSNPEPVFSIARFFLRATINLSSESEKLEDGQNQISGLVNTHRLVFTLGKFSLCDIFDNNNYAHDARNQFMNWSLMASAAWDYPADVKGYTYAFSAEYIVPGFAVRSAIAMVSTVANGPDMDTDIKNNYGLVLELEKSFLFAGRKGITRIILFQNKANMGNYNDVINNPGYNMDITNSRLPGRTKTGFVINNEYSLNDNLGIFLKYSWNDGKTETWEFTEIDHSLSFGLVAANVKLFNKPGEFGFACAINGLSDDHRDYLAKGVYGFIIGDSKLNYGLETIFEVYYKVTIFNLVSLTPDYQFIINPAYNIDRGPVNIFSLRTHVEF